MSLGHGANIVTDGLTLYLDAANPKSYSGSGNTWFDLSGNGNNGTLTNGPTYDSENKGSIVFDGLNDYVNITNSTIGDFGVSNFTVSCFGKAASGSTGYRGIFSKYNPHSSNGTGWFMYYRDGAVTVRITQDLTEPLEASSITKSIATNQWHFFSITRDAKLFSLYVNGYLLQQNTTTNIIDCSSSAPLRVGSGYSSGYYYSGNVPVAQIYNRALSATEIRQNFEATRDRYGI